ncbi:MAG TPA: amino acid ABC transporter permease [Ilumatobacter sp.]|nr:amino acid ABC transporter permease [Ilumatobacter sp.]
MSSVNYDPHAGAVLPTGNESGATRHRDDTEPWYETFPWWAVLMGIIFAVLVGLVVFDAGYNQAYDRIIPGLWLTVKATLASFAIACSAGLLLALMRTSGSVVMRNLSRTYVEFIRGIPMLVLIFTITLVVVPEVSNSLGMQNRISPFWRAVIALSLIYAGYIAEIFRAGIESVDRGQVEAGRSLGLSRRDTTRSIVLPQALRAVVPPLGNDFIAVLKDTSLLSTVGVLEITQNARQYSAGSFKFRDAYLATTLIYLSLTILLSLLLAFLERRLSAGRTAVRS